MPRGRVLCLRKIGRDTVLFTVGLGLTVNEALFETVNRPGLLVLFAAMMGLPAILRFDESKHEK